VAYGFGPIWRLYFESAFCTVALFTSLFLSLRLSFQRVYYNLQVTNKRFDINVEVRKAILGISIVRCRGALERLLAQFAQIETVSSVI
jgi:hypothetical protein